MADNVTYVQQPWGTPPKDTVVKTTDDGTAQIQHVAIDAVGSGVVSDNNSTSALLAGDAVFTGTSDDVLGWATIRITLKSDVASATDGLDIQFSSDNTNWDTTDNYTIAANTHKTYAIPVQDQYFRLIYTNGSDPQTDFHISVIYSRFGAIASSHRVGDTVSSEDDAQLVKAILSAEKPDGTQANIDATAGGNLKVSVEEFDAGVLGQDTMANSLPVTIASDQSAVEVTASTPLDTSDYYLEVRRGNITNVSTVKKFGANAAVGTSLEPITTSGTYQTPTTAQSLEILSDDANDTSGGSGAQTVTVEGLDASWNEQSETVTMDGTTPAALSNTFIRVFRMFVATTGTYATTAAFSQAGTITLRGASGGVTWAVLDEETANQGFGQSEIACYTVPTGKTAYLIDRDITIETTKQVDVILMVREGADDVATPFTAMRLKDRHIGVTESYTPSSKVPELKITGPADVIYMGKSSAGTSGVSVTFSLIVDG